MINFIFYLFFPFWLTFFFFLFFSFFVDFFFFSIFIISSFIPQAKPNVCILFVVRATLVFREDSGMFYLSAYDNKD